MKISAVRKLLVAVLLAHLASGEHSIHIGNGLFENAKNISQYEWLTQVVIKHLDEIKESSPINIVVHSKANPAISETLVTSYTSRHPSILLKNVDFVQVCRHMICDRVHNFVGIFDDISDIKPVEWKKVYQTGWDPKSHFAIWITGQTSTEVVQSVFETFWSLNCINVIFLVISSNSTDINVLSYDPFWIKSADSRGRVNHQNISAVFFPDKLQNLQGLPIQVSMYELFPVAVITNYSSLSSGVEVELIRYLSGSLNFTVELITAPVSLSAYTTKLPNGEVVGALGDLLKNRSEVLGNTQIQDTVINRNVEFVQLFVRTETWILVPPGKPMPGLVRTFRSVNLTAFIIIMTLMSLHALAMQAKGKQYPVYNTFQLLLFQNYHHITSMTSERMYFMTWIIFLYLFSVIFQGHLIKDLTDPPYYPDINTLHELLNSGLKLSLDPGLYPALNYSESRVKRQLAERAELEPKFDSCMKKLDKGIPIACAGDFLQVARIIHSPNRTKDDGERKYHVMQTPLQQSWRVMVVRTGFPYIEKFERLAWRLIQGGLPKKWYFDTFNYTSKFQTGNNVQALNLEDCEGIFYILLLGNSVAFIVLIVEICHRQMKKRYFSNSIILDEYDVPKY